MAIDNSRARPPKRKSAAISLSRRQRNAAGDVAITGRTSSLNPASPSQRNPDAEEPEAPVVEVGVEDRLHPAAVVVERLVVVSTLIQPTPGEVRGWGTPVRPTWATRPIAPVAGPTWASRSAWPVVRASGPAWRATAAVARSTLRTARSTRAATVRRGILPTWSALGSARPSWSAWPTRAARSLAGSALGPARWRARLRSREADPSSQCGDTDADGDRGGTGHALEKHGHFSFRGISEAP
ncbi:MAG: hypothetical protein JWP55_2006 [Mycobacterium sp.]|nr:hypothetical protein [Mycobacterium sp.]